MTTRVVMTLKCLLCRTIWTQPVPPGLEMSPPCPSCGVEGGATVTAVLGKENT